MLGALRKSALITSSDNTIFETRNEISNTSQSIPLVKEWFQTCQKLHAACNYQTQRYTPTRLLDLQAPHPKLCLSSLLKGKDLQYATLSHCWGASTAEVFKLTKSTLASYMTGVKIEELPKTFQDAIKTCSKLKIRYIWIDSLCIIQDDTEDWIRESVTMTDIYGNCVLNIAASSASSGNQGCFYKRQHISRCHISLKSDENTNTSFVCTNTERHPLDDHNVCPLELRGWTLQERLLSPRTVHFTREEVFWECRSKFASESAPFNCKGPYSLSKNSLSMKRWIQIVREYATRKLTYEKDRLIALAGIAEKIQQQTNNEYCAGMWYGENLIDHLCWTFSPSVRERVSPPRAPTWSWASISGDFRILHCTLNIRLSKVLKLEKPTSGNQFGDMPNAVLWLSCPPLLITKATPPQNLTVLNELANDDYLIRIDCLEDNVLFYRGDAAIYFLRLTDTGGLILTHANHVQGQYRRIGWCSTNTIPSTKVEEICNDKTNHAEESAYVPRENHEFDNESHVITLV